MRFLRHAKHLEIHREETQREIHYIQRVKVVENVPSGVTIMALDSHGLSFSTI